jgi:hypothetical protein
MSEEIPEPNPPLLVEEHLAVARLTDADLGIIDAAILNAASNRWLKVARVVAFAADELGNRYPDLSYIFYALRLTRLVEHGSLESEGNIAYMRFSEVRIPARPTRV